jgi:phage-related protein
MAEDFKGARSNADTELDGAGIGSIVSFLYHGSVKPLAGEEQEELETPVMRPVVWLGNSRRNMQAFPADARRTIGGELQLMQYGGMPKDAKPFKGIGSGVMEIAIRHDGEAYRTVVALQLGRAIYVLHAFQKKSKRGIATPKQDVDLIKQRYKEAQELAEDEQG